MGRAREFLRVHLGICVLSVLAAGVAVVSKLVFFRHGSGDLDEAVYLLQARALASGHLTFSAAQHGEFFRPWLTGEHDGRLFTKYLPGYPGLLAMPLVLFGTATPALPCIAVGWVVATYAIALELFGRRRVALIAASLTVLSPIFLVHSALFLSYGLSVALLLGGAALVLRASRTGRLAPAVWGGSLLGFDVLVRQYDVVLLVVLLAAWLLLRTGLSPLGRTGLRGTGLRSLGRTAVAVLAGAVPWLLLTMLYDTSVTGAPLRMPLSATDPEDRFGFGRRRILPGQPEVPYGVHDALHALSINTRAVPSWAVGGILLLALALVGLVVGSRRREKLLVLALVLAFPVGYFFFWGTALSSKGALNGIGPHYYVPVFAGLAVLAAVGVDEMVRRTRRVAVPVLALLAVVAVPLTWQGLGPKLAVQRYVDAQRASVLAPLRAERLREPAVVLVELPPEQGRTAVGNPYGFLLDPPDLSAQVLYAADQGAGNWVLPDAAPGRALYALRPRQLVDAEAPFGPRGALVPLKRVAGVRLRIDVTATAGAGRRCLSAYLVVAGRTTTASLTCDPRTGTGYRHSFVLGAGGLPLPPVGSSTLLVAGVATGSGSGAERAEVRDSLGVVAAAGGAEARLLDPGPGWRLVAFPNLRVWLPARVAPALEVRVTAEG